MYRTYITTKEQAQRKAIKWQEWQSKQAITYSEYVKWHDYFLRLALRFKLLKEFKENGII